MSVKQRASLVGLTERQYQLRVTRSLMTMHPEKLYDAIPKEQKLILLIDGIWLHVEKRRAIAYLAVLRPIHSNTAYALPPRVEFGAERVTHWEELIELIPMEIRSRIVALTCDGLTGMTKRGEKHGWVVQRCQFHFIKTVERFRGTKNQYVKNKEFREALYQTIRKALETRDTKKAEVYREMIEVAMCDERCPRWIRRHLGELLNYFENYRSCHREPHLHLPPTNGTMESLCGIVRDRLYIGRGFRTMASMRRWVIGLIVTQKTIRSNGV